MKSLKSLSALLIVLLTLNSCKQHEEQDIKVISMMIWGDHRLNSPMNIKVSDALLAEFSASDFDDNGLHPVEQMMLKWDEAYPSAQFFKLPMETTSNLNYRHVQSFNDGEMGIYVSHDWFDNVSPSALAITQFYAVKKSNGQLGYLELLHADIILNYKDHDFSMDKNDDWSYYLPSVILHELGHFLGLSHQSNYSQYSIMQPFLGMSESPNSVSELDKLTLSNNYNKTPTTSLGAFQLSSLSAGKNDGEIVRGVIELDSNGKCHHYLDGKLLKSH